ncbi:tetraacyldisaccharide 4'-kinase [Desulforhopalus singaporensis]|uniref:Tetraacyldisaccharide 4'-kinase n=1 Tax=Desulforhopalus singaporensis TaxID=91360 RepID=A0A1H0PJM4_9BACT|nr:tetraacyldisaccharide 4'-kinase [Desulforhopalus singaporensis]SDP04845.1 lipid-A-disaccharide kinase [Desulforhopalus singaporensis]
MNFNHQFFFSCGRPFSPFYGLAMKLRQYLYSKNILKRHTLPVSVISVGNLVLGGSGKTPMVQFLAKYLQNKGHKVAVVSRGYRGKASNRYNIVSDTSRVFLDAEQAGDEPVLLARSLPGIPVLTGKKRIHPCNEALKRFQVDCIILDDGFQHMAVERDLNIVLFDATFLAGNSRVLPAGHLREPVSSLKRADCFVVTGVNRQNRERAEAFGSLLTQKFISKKLYYSSISICNCVSFYDRKTISLEGVPIAVFCGIANPERFRSSVTEAGGRIVSFTAFGDHQPYSQKHFDKLASQAESAGARLLVTTEKDGVKLAGLNLHFPVALLVVEQNPDHEFEQLVMDRLDIFNSCNIKKQA